MSPWAKTLTFSFSLLSGLNRTVTLNQKKVLEGPPFWFFRVPNYPYVCFIYSERERERMWECQWVSVPRRSRTPGLFGSNLSKASSHVIGHLLLSSPADPDEELQHTAPDAYPALLPWAPETLRHLDIFAKTPAYRSRCLHPTATAG